jgi:hypothetical protein
MAPSLAPTRRLYTPVALPATATCTSAVSFANLSSEISAARDTLGSKLAIENGATPGGCQANSGIDDLRDSLETTPGKVTNVE